MLSDTDDYVYITVGHIPTKRCIEIKTPRKIGEETPAEMAEELRDYISQFPQRFGYPSFTILKKEDLYFKVYAEFWDSTPFYKSSNSPN